MRRYSARLNTESLNDLVKQLEDYRDSLDYKNQVFIDKLLDHGIEVAKYRVIDRGGPFGTHQMGSRLNLIQ